MRFCWFCRDIVTVILSLVSSDAATRCTSGFNQTLYRRNRLWKNGKVATTGGSYTETKEQLGGLLVLEARDMNHALQLISQHPAVKPGSIFEIRPMGEMNEIIQKSEQRRRTLTAR